MKTYLSFISLGIIFLILTGCKKVGKNDIDATIYVKEYKTGVPFAYVKVILTKWLQSI